MIRLVTVTKLGAEVAGPHYEFTGEDTSQNMAVKFRLDHSTGAATNDLIAEHGRMNVLVRQHQMVDAWSLTPAPSND
jgi:hypothetical protein